MMEHIKVGNPGSRRIMEDGVDLMGRTWEMLRMDFEEEGCVSTAG